MRISELSRRSDVPVATIKYYLREGLLPPGERTSATQALYSEAHVDRLELIRALLGPARLSVEAAGRVLGVIDDPPETFLDVLGAAQTATAPTAASGTATDEDPDLGPARELVAELGWTVDPDSVELTQLANGLRAVEAGGIDVVDGGLARYGHTVHDLAEAEVATVPTDEISRAVRQAVLGTVLLEPVLLSLRRLAQQDVAGRLFTDAERPDQAD